MSCFAKAGPTVSPMFPSSVEPRAKMSVTSAQTISVSLQFHEEIWFDVRPTAVIHIICSGSTVIGSSGTLLKRSGSRDGGTVEEIRLM